MSDQQNALENISEKLDKLVEQTHVFTPEEVKKINEALNFVKPFNGDSATLKHIQDLYLMINGWVKVTKTIGAVLAFIVVLWVNWDRLMDLIGLRPTP